MMKKNADAWQKDMYDVDFARRTIDSGEYHALARNEVEFLSVALGLRKGETLLDVPCGTGRHATLFAKRGLEVTALDLSPALIRIARKSTEKKILDRSGRPVFSTGNMIDLSAYRGQFDVVTNLFTSFGYFSNEEKNLKVMREMVGALRPGGRLAIHFINREWLMKVFQHHSWSESKDFISVETRDYNAKTYRIQSRSLTLDKKTGKGKAYLHETRLYSSREIQSMMRKCGLKDLIIYGDMEGAMFQRERSPARSILGGRLRYPAVISAQPAADRFFASLAIYEAGNE